MTFDRPTLSRLFRYCYSLTGDDDAAYDLLHQSIERYLKAAKRQHIDAPVAYLRRIIRNRFIDDLRRARRLPEVSLEELQESVVDLSTTGLERQMVAAGDMAIIWRQLSPVEREALYLWAVEGRTASEIAEDCGVSRNTILSRLHRLRQKFKGWYSDEDRGDEEVSS
ncbi:MAG: RNA polymerase sigma factor [Bradymonadia bacterium]